MFVVAVILVLCAANWSAPRREFSENENRYLAQFPLFSAKAVLTGEFHKRFEEYATDQFVGRDFWVAGKAHLEKMLGKKENNGVYFAKDGYLIEKQPPNDPGRVETNIEAVLKLEELSQYRTGFLLVPTASEILKEKLPPFAYQPAQRNVMDQVQQALEGRNIRYIDPTEALRSHREEYIYYRTDHHETTAGAYLAYVDAVKAFDITPYSEVDFNQATVSSAFLGTTWSKAMLRDTPKDTITAYYPKFLVDYEMYFPAEDKRLQGLYAPGHLATKDQYAFFLDGNHPIVEITSTVHNGRRLAIFKDSYAHCIIPFLANHYEKIYVMDLRYYNLDPFAYLQEHEIDDILLIYNAQNFATDVNIAKLGIYIED
jgi:hypothetical protein